MNKEADTRVLPAHVENGGDKSGTRCLAEGGYVKIFTYRQFSRRDENARKYREGRIRQTGANYQGVRKGSSRDEASVTGHARQPCYVDVAYMTTKPSAW